MSDQNAASAYQRHAVQTANGPLLLLMLCDRMSVDIARAEVALEASDNKAANEHLQHAQKIVRMLRSALDPDGFQGAYELLAVYIFLEAHLIKANLEKDAALVQECADLIRPIHEAWRKAVNANERADASSHMG
ncbi:MAG: flagellar export chaperone FliS [Acidimicrobiales bacterium]